VFAGEFYERPRHGVLSNFVTSEPIKALSKRDFSLYDWLVLSAGIVGAVLVVRDIVPRIEKLRKGKGVVKIVEREEDDIQIASEGKGHEERLDFKNAALAGKLKSLSASMSMERAVSGTGKTGGQVNVSTILKACQNTVVLLKGLVGNESFRYSYQVVQRLKDLLEKVQTALELQGKNLTRNWICDIRDCEDRIISAVSKRNLSQPSVYKGLFALHCSMLTIYELTLENVVVPSICQEIETGLSLGGVDDDVTRELRNILTVEPSKLPHHLVSASLLLNNLDPNNDSVPVLKSHIEELTVITDELLSSRTLLKVFNSVDEMSRLVEGKVFNSLVFALEKSCLELGAPKVPGKNSYPDADTLGLLLRLQVLLRKEQQERMEGSIQPSIHDVALWKHLVNACNEISSLCCSNSNGLESRTFFSEMVALVTYISSRCSARLGTIPLDSSERMSFANLIMEPELVYRKTQLTDLRSVTLLRRVKPAPFDDESVQIVRAVHAYLCKIVETIIPGSTTGLSIGSSTGDDVTVSFGVPDENDVIVCFIIGTTDKSCKQLTFVSKSCPQSTQNALHEALGGLSFGDCLIRSTFQGGPRHAETSKNSFDTVLDMLDRFNAYSMTELPTRLGVRLQSQENVSLIDERLGLDEDESRTSSMIITPLMLQQENKFRFFPCKVSPSKALVAMLLDDIVVVGAKSLSQAQDMAQRISEHQE